MRRKKLTKADREEMDERHARVHANAERLRQLAERAQARLEGRSDPRLAFLGDSTIYQEGQRFEVTAALFAEGSAPASSFFGHYWNAVPPEVRTGPARIQFSDGSEADAMLATIDPDKGGFRISGYLEDTAELMKARRRSSA
jgi:hypothetical protein